MVLFIPTLAMATSTGKNSNIENVYKEVSVEIASLNKQLSLMNILIKGIMQEAKSSITDLGK